MAKYRPDYTRKPILTKEQIVMNHVVTRKASAKDMVLWIALNDEPTWGNRENVANQMTVLLAADTLGVEPDQLADWVIHERKARNTRFSDI